MTKSIVALLLSLSSVATVVYADPAPGLEGPGKHHHPNPHSVKAPEIDPATTGSALTLLIGGVLVLRSRVAKR